MKLMLVFLLTTSCATKKIETSVAASKNTEDGISVENVLSSEAPQALNPEQQKYPKTVYWTSLSTLIPQSGMDSMVAASLIGAITGISQVFQGTESNTDLNGSCIYGEPESPIVSRCLNVKVFLLNERSEIVATSTTDLNGNFRFFIPKGRYYQVQVVDRKGRTAITKQKLGRSNYVLIYLKL